MEKDRETGLEASTEMLRRLGTTRKTHPVYRINNCKKVKYHRLLKHG